MTIDDSNLLPLADLTRRFFELEATTSLEESLARATLANSILDHGPAIVRSTTLPWNEFASELKGLVTRELPPSLAKFHLALKASTLLLCIGEGLTARQLMASLRYRDVEFGHDQSKAPSFFGTWFRSVEDLLFDRLVAPSPIAWDRPTSLSLRFDEYRKNCHVEIEALRGMGPADPWLELLAQAVYTKDLVPLANATKRGGQFAETRERIAAYLLALALNDGFMLSRLQAPKYTLKTKVDRERDDPELVKACLIAKAVDDYFVGATPITVELVAHELGVVDSIVSPLFKLLLHGALRTAVRRQLESPHVDSMLDEKLQSLAAKLGLPSEVFDPLARKSRRTIPLALAGAWHSLSFKIKSLSATESERATLVMEVQTRLADLLGERFADGHGVLKKLTQLGLGFEGIVPEEVRKQLAARCFGIPTQKDARYAELLENHLAHDGTPVFRRVDQVPLAHGSLGVVYRCETTTGHDVAVKVRYDNIERTLTGDGKHHRRLSMVAGPYLKGIDLEAVLNGWQGLVTEECDYRTECETQAEASRIFQTDDAIRVPRPFPEFSTDRILVQEYVEGERFYQFADNATKEQKQRAAFSIMRAVLTLYGHRLFNYDLHPGNFLFNHGKVFILDWGGVVDGRRDYLFSTLDFIKILRAGKRADAWEMLKESGFYDPGVPQSVWEEVVDRNLSLYYRPFVVDEEFEFTPDYVKQVFLTHINVELKKGIIRFPSDRKMHAIRWYWSLYSLMARLGGNANWGRLAEEVAKSSADLRKRTA